MSASNAADNVMKKEQCVQGETSVVGGIGFYFPKYLGTGGWLICERFLMEAF